MQELIDVAKKVINERYEKGKHGVGAAVRTKSGKVYTGICMNSQKVDICAEWVAIGKALTDGDKEIEMVVSVHRDEEGNFEIYPPCALCRELYLTYCPNVQVILSNEEAVRGADLLPQAWIKKR